MTERAGVRTVLLALLPRRTGRRTLADWLAMHDIEDVWRDACRDGGA